MIDQAIFSDMQAVGFDQASALIENGDLLLCSGQGLVSNMIKDATGSVFSHVAMLLKLPVTGQWLVLESVETKGVRCVTLEQGYLQNYCDSNRAYLGHCLVARHAKMAQKANLYSTLYQRAFSLLGDKYNEADIFKIGMRIALRGVGINEHGELHPGHTYICSEYVYACFASIGIQLPFDSRGFIAPATIANDPNVSPVLVLNTSYETNTRQTSEPVVVA